MEGAHIIKKGTDLSTDEIKTILTHWDVPLWRSLVPDEFFTLFGESEFHLLTDKQHRILSLARINFNFHIRINNRQYEFAELVGFVSVVKGSGYGSSLLSVLTASLKARTIETIGFCERPLRPFYERCGTAILYDRAKYLREGETGEWVSSTDDDILILNLSDEKLSALKSLSATNPGYLIFE